ncbi:MAG: hypothetical protein SOH58_07835 [Olsenella sp.]
MRSFGLAAGGGSFSPVTPVFQIDDGYARVGDWTSPDPARFPDGMGAMADAIRAAGPVMSALGRCEYCRVGCDVGLDWDGRRYMRITGRERVSTRNSLANTRGRAHLDGRAFLNDPDLFFLRDDVRLTQGQRQELLFTDASLGGMLLTSDDMGAWDAGQRACFGRALAEFEARAARYSAWPAEIVGTRRKK